MGALDWFRRGAARGADADSVSEYDEDSDIDITDVQGLLPLKKGDVKGALAVAKQDSEDDRQVHAALSELVTNPAYDHLISIADREKLHALLGDLNVAHVSQRTALQVLDILAQLDVFKSLQGAQAQFERSGAQELATSKNMLAIVQTIASENLDPEDEAFRSELLDVLNTNIQHTKERQLAAARITRAAVNQLTGRFSTAQLAVRGAALAAVWAGTLYYSDPIKGALSDGYHATVNAMTEVKDLGVESAIDPDAPAVDPAEQTAKK